MTCKGCGETYIGQTSKNAYTRGKEHVSTVTTGRRTPRNAQSQLPPPSAPQALPHAPPQAPSQASSQPSSQALSQTGVRRKQPKPTIQHHVDDRHADDPTPPKFKMEVTKVYRGDALLRQVGEAIQIRETPGQMNRQEEWRQIQLPRLGLL